MVLGAHIYLCMTELDFLEKIPIGQEWPEMVFGLFKKVTSLVLSGICVKWKYGYGLWFISHGSLIFCENCMLGKNLVLKL